MRSVIVLPTFNERENIEVYLRAVRRLDAPIDVLVVDDDPGVREVTEDTLGRVGLTVLTAADGREGIEMFRKHRDHIRLVLLDRTMPITGGEEALEAIRAIDPDAQVILVSGYSRERAAARISSGDLAGFLKKPFLPEALIALVRAVFEPSGGGR